MVKVLWRHGEGVMNTKMKKQRKKRRKKKQDESVMNVKLDPYHHVNCICGQPRTRDTVSLNK